MPSGLDAWHIITCEYPPRVGGVSDYAEAMAGALARAGHAVHVWCPDDGPVPSQAPGITVHAVREAFSRAGLARIDQALDRYPGPRHLFVQWVPHGFGYRALNIFVARWLASRARRGDQVHLLVHEPFVEFSLRPRQLVVAVVQRLMLVVAAARAERIWVSTPSWLPLIARFVPAGARPAWLPIPAPHVASVRARLDTPGHAAATAVVGHFSTHAPLVTQVLAPALEELLQQTGATVLLIGRDSDRFRASYLHAHPAMASRIRATGVLDSDAIDAAVASCTAMLQPYPDGISTRRTSALTLMSSGVPVVTNAGRLTEGLWSEDGAVELVDAPDGRKLGAATAALLRDPARRSTLAARAAAIYDSRFDIRHSVAALTASRRLEASRA